MSTALSRGPVKKGAYGNTTGNHVPKSPLNLFSMDCSISERPDYSHISSIVPPRCGYREFKPTLCIGLDIAWFGGSKGDLDSQHDCVVAAVIAPGHALPILDIQRVSLTGRDPSGILTARAIGLLIHRYGDQVQNIVLGIDAPLLSTQVIPKGRERAWRSADRVLSDTRKAIDQHFGGSQGWHPTLQPGAPLAPRVVSLLGYLKSEFDFHVWSPDDQDREKLILEVFPSEAIWAMKRHGGYAAHSTAEKVRRYKKLKGTLLSELDVHDILTHVLAPVGPILRIQKEWQFIQEESLNWMLSDPSWVQGEGFRGGKLLDDVVDSLLCLASSISYTLGLAHSYLDMDKPEDGHIIGPGLFSEANESMI